MESGQTGKYKRNPKQKEILRKRAEVARQGKEEKKEMMELVKKTTDIPMDFLKSHLVDPRSKKRRVSIAPNKSYSINSRKLDLNPEEALLYTNYWKEIARQVLTIKKTISIIDETYITAASYAWLRLHKKAKWESQGNTFLDQQVTQDPLRQIIECMKQLGIQTKVNISKTEKHTKSISLTEEILQEGNLEDNIDQDLDYQKWAQHQQNREIITENREITIEKNKEIG